MCQGSRLENSCKRAEYLVCCQVRLQLKFLPPHHHPKSFFTENIWNWLKIIFTCNTYSVADPGSCKEEGASDPQSCTFWHIVIVVSLYWYMWDFLDIALYWELSPINIWRKNGSYSAQSFSGSKSISSCPAKCIRRLTWNSYESLWSVIKDAKGCFYTNCW